MFRQIHTSPLVILAIPVLVLGLTVATANADTIYVCWDGSGDYLTIQEGIDAAQDGDEVVVCDGVYTGPGNRDIDFGGKAITVCSANGPDNCIIDCEGSGRGFYFHNGETMASVVDGVTITDGLASDGGGVSCYWWSSPTLTNCTITGNTAAYSGAGVFCEDYSSPTLSNCTITGNSAGSDGGGVSCDDNSSPTLSNCTIAGNTAGLGGGGLGCYYDSSPTLTNCTITGNTAEGVNGAGGGVHCLHNGNPTLNNCTIVGNTAGYGGGGVLCGNSSVILANCILWANWAYHVGPQGYVGGSSSVLSVSYSDVEDGQAGIYVDGGTLDWGPGNIDADPLFVDPDGPDNDPDTWEDNDYHIGAGSPCIDAADNEAVPDGIRTDLDGNPRFVDDACTDDMGSGEPPIVDMGAYEYQPCAGDLNCDGQTGQADLGILLADWGCDDPVDGCDGDLNGDDKTNQSDLGILLADWGCGT